MKRRAVNRGQELKRFTTPSGSIITSCPFSVTTASLKKVVTICQQFWLLPQHPSSQRTGRTSHLLLPLPLPHSLLQLHLNPSATRLYLSPKKKMDKATEAMQYAMGFLKRKASSPHTGFLQYLESCRESLPDNKAKKLKRQIIELAHSVQDEE